MRHLAHTGCKKKAPVQIQITILIQKPIVFNFQRFLSVKNSVFKTCLVSARKRLVFI